LSQWTAQPPLQLARGGLGAVTVGGSILAIGGFDGVNVFDAVELRRAAGTGKWRYLEPMPTARADLATAVLGGLVYAVGGYEPFDPSDIDDGQSDRVETFNPRTGHWAKSRPLPELRGAPGAAALGGRLYVAGGDIPLRNGQSHITDSVTVYDPRKNTWKPVAPMPTVREKLRLVAAGRYLYAMGGQDRAGKSLTTVERYDPATNRWRTMNPMVQSRSLAGAVETKVGQRHVLVVVGGGEFSATGTFLGARRTTEVFDLATGRWTLLDMLLPTARGSLHSATETDGTILAIGGFVGGGRDGGTPTPIANVDALSLKPRDLR
jgi:N-acetylneuraminic acid mutarotase